MVPCDCHDQLQRAETNSSQDVDEIMIAAVNGSNRNGAGFFKIGQLSGTPGKIRTCDLLIRSQTLYPTELRAHLGVAFDKSCSILPAVNQPTQMYLSVQHFFGMDGSIRSVSGTAQSDVGLFCVHAMALRVKEKKIEVKLNPFKGDRETAR